MCAVIQKKKSKCISLSCSTVRLESGLKSIAYIKPLDLSQIYILLKITPFIDAYNHIHRPSADLASMDQTHKTSPANLLSTN